MKRIWIAAVILLLTFSATLAHSVHIKIFVSDLSAILEEAEENAEQGDWAGAKELTQAAWEKWEANDSYLHITLRHSETDDIHTGFREVEEFIECEESGEYSAANAKLIAELSLLAEGEQFTLKNIL